MNNFAANRQGRLLILGCFAVGLLGSGCTNEKRIARGKPLRSINANQVLEAYGESALQWNWLGMKIDANVESNRGSDSFKANIRMAKDSAIWISISPALGVEVARILLTHDSVHVLSKIPGNRFFYRGNYDAMSDWADTPLQFSDIQEILTGRPMGILPEQDKFNSRIDGLNYVLLSKYKRRVRRLVGVNNNALAPNDSLGILVTDRRYERVKSRADDNDLLIKRHWFDGVHFDPLKDLFDDLYYQRALTITRSQFESTDTGRLPRFVQMAIETPNGSVTMDMDIIRLRIGRAYDFPFEIPVDYEERSSF